MRRQKTKNIPLLTAIAESGFTGQELAARCGLNPVTVSHALNNRVDPSAATIEALSRVLKKSPAKIGFPSELEGSR